MTIGTISAFLSVFILYTISKTKLYWYIFPCFILIAIYGSIQIVKLSKKLKSYSFIIIFLICASCLSTFNYVFSVTSNDKTQNFINSITNVSSIDLYIETETTNGWSQQNLLCSELALDANCLSGGINGFLSNENSYIIVDTNKLQLLDENSIQIIYFSDNLFLCKNTSLQSGSVFYFK